MLAQMKPMTICVTGAAGQISYSFLPQLLRGAAFPGVPIHLRLLEVEPALKTLRGVVMELEDCAFPLLQSIAMGSNSDEMFKDCDVIVFLGGFPRKPGMERKDLLQINKEIFVNQAKSLSHASPNVKCLVIANPANTNACILTKYATHIPKRNITCLSRLDHNRAISLLSTETGVHSSQIDGVMIFGNHSLTQYPCIAHMNVCGKPASEKVSKEWLENTFIQKVQKRGGQILQARGMSSVSSAASAVIDHLHDWFVGTGDKIVSMGVISQGKYGIPEGLITSLPVRCKNFDYEVVTNVELTEFCHKKIAITVAELQQEIEMATSK